MTEAFKRTLLYFCALTIFHGSHAPPFIPSARAEEINFPVCNLTDELSTGLDGILHRFGADLPQYPNEFSLPGSYPAFDQVFDLYVTDGVSSRWTQAEFSTLISSIMNNDTLSTSDDIFGKVWGYFCRSDSDLNPHHAGVRYNTPFGQRRKIKIRLYDRGDVPNPCPPNFGDNVCRGYSFQADSVITINASQGTPMADVLGLGIAHELQHVCWLANGLGPTQGYYVINETMSTLAEYFANSWRPATFDRSYDASILRFEDCDVSSKYDTEKVWVIYLYETFRVRGVPPV